MNNRITSVIRASLGAWGVTAAVSPPLWARRRKQRCWASGWGRGGAQGSPPERQEEARFGSAWVFPRPRSKHVLAWGLLFVSSVEPTQRRARFTPRLCSTLPMICLLGGSSHCDPHLPPQEGVAMSEDCQGGGGLPRGGQGCREVSAMHGQPPSSPPPPHTQRCRAPNVSSTDWDTAVKPH